MRGRFVGTIVLAFSGLPGTRLAGARPGVRPTESSGVRGALLTHRQAGLHFTIMHRSPPRHGVGLHSVQFWLPRAWEDRYRPSLGSARARLPVSMGLAQRR